MALAGDFDEAARGAGLAQRGVEQPRLVLQRLRLAAGVEHQEGRGAGVDEADGRDGVFPALRAAEALVEVAVAAAQGVGLRVGGVVGGPADGDDAADGGRAEAEVGERSGVERDARGELGAGRVAHQEQRIGVAAEAAHLPVYPGHGAGHVLDLRGPVHAGQQAVVDDGCADPARGEEPTDVAVHVRTTGFQVLVSRSPAAPMDEDHRRPARGVGSGDEEVETVLLGVGAGAVVVGHVLADLRLGQAGLVVEHGDADAVDGETAAAGERRGEQKHRE